MPNASFAPRDVAVLGECLRAAVDGPFLRDARALDPWWELHTLVGATHDTLTVLAREWSPAHLEAPDVRAIAGNVVNALLGYPHGMENELPRWVTASRDELTALLQRITHRSEEHGEVLGVGVRGAITLPSDRPLVRRLRAGDDNIAQRLFAVMAEAFEEPNEPQSDASMQRLLSRDDLWILAALDGDAVLGGLTAHVLPMTRVDGVEVFIYDLAVAPSVQRRGIGRALVADVRVRAQAIGALSVFVPADVEDDHALAFYEAIGGDAAPVTMFTFVDPPAD